VLRRYTILCFLRLIGGFVQRSHFISVSTAWMTLISCSALAGPPFITDDPEPVDAQTWEVNYAISKTWRDGGASVGMPSIDINYGLTKDIQLHAQPKIGFEKETGHHSIAIDNTEVGIKYRFIDHENKDGRWMIGIYPMLQLPTGDSKLGISRGKAQLFLPLWLQYNSNGWTIYGGSGYRVNRYQDGKNSIFTGITALYRINNRTKIGAEVYSESASVIGDKHSSGFNFAGIYNLTEDYHVLFSVGRALNNIDSTNQLSAYLGLQAIY
jgi:hypothetical protein